MTRCRFLLLYKIRSIAWMDGGLNAFGRSFESVLDLIDHRGGVSSDGEGVDRSARYGLSSMVTTARCIIITVRVV